MSKRGRKPIGDRQTFNCPADLYDYVDRFRREQGYESWADALRHLIVDHRRNRKTVSNKSHELGGGVVM